MREPLKNVLNLEDPILTCRGIAFAKGILRELQLQQQNKNTTVSYNCCVYYARVRVVGWDAARLCMQLQTEGISQFHIGNVVSY